jgi:hypothetical protein
MSSSAPPPGTKAPRETALALEPSRGWRRRRGDGAIRLSALGAEIVCDGVLAEPLRLPLGMLQIGAIDAGPARPGGIAARFAVLRRLSATTVLPITEGIEGWLWTTLAGSAFTSLGDEEEAPNAALLFTKPLSEEHAGAFHPDFLQELAGRSPLGTPAVHGLLFRVVDTAAAERVFRQFGLLRPLTDREVPPVMRRSLPTDRPADTRLEGGADRRVATSVAPPGVA